MQFPVTLPQTQSNLFIFYFIAKSQRLSSDVNYRLSC